jgi:hypothetical protein
MNNAERERGVPGGSSRAQTRVGPLSGDNE